MKYTWNNHPCIKDAVLYPEVGTLKEIGISEGDRAVLVSPTDCEWCGWIGVFDGHVLNLEKGGFFDPAYDREYGRRYRTISRTQPSPVRTVTTTRQEIVSGEYGKVVVGDEDVIWVEGSMQDAEELTAVIDTLTAIRDAMQANTTA